MYRWKYACGPIPSLKSCQHVHNLEFLGSILYVNLHNKI
jgi:hypothetical protein